MQKSTASPTSAESANLQLQQAILLHAALFFWSSTMVSRYFFLQRVKQPPIQLSDLAYTVHSGLIKHMQICTKSSELQLKTGQRLGRQ